MESTPTTQAEKLRAALNYLAEQKISITEDFRSPIQIAEIHKATGSTALVESMELPYKRQIISEQNIVDV